MKILVDNSGNIEGANGEIVAVPLDRRAEMYQLAAAAGLIEDQDVYSQVEIECPFAALV